MALATQYVPGIETYLDHQDWESYTQDDHAVWEILYRRRVQQLERAGSRLFLDGLDAIGLAPGSLPRLASINERLSRRTGWRAIAVNGYLPAREFFACLAQRQFPTTVVIRSRESIDYTPAPDIFHDVFGHVPMHASPVFADFLAEVGRIGAAATDDRLTELARLFWFTVEFGLVRENGEVRLYGSGLMSSPGEGEHALSDACERRPFDLGEVVARDFRIDVMQPVLYVIDSFEQLYEAVTDWAAA